MKRALIAGGLLVLIAGSALVFAPYQTHMAWRRAAMRLGGARRVAAGPLLAYEKNLCRPGAPCRCVALVHGMGDSALTWHKTMLGKDGATAPPEGTLLLAVDMPGTEGSLPVKDYGIRAQARVLREALEARCPEWTVAGNSLGGWMSGWLAVDWPQGVRELILVNAAGLNDPSGQALKAAKTLADPTVPEMKIFNAKAYGKPRPVPERAWAPAVAGIRARPTRAILDALTVDDVLDGRLRDIKARTAVLWGAADGVLPMEFAQRFHAGVKGSRLEMIPGCGHLPQQECPATVSSALFGAKP